MLPGLEPPRANDTPMVRAMRSTIKALDADHRLEPRHAALMQLCLSLAQAIDGGARSGRASAVAMAAAQLRETLLVLDPPPEDGDTGNGASKLAELMAQLEAVANGGQP
jgi:hypothetical protein